MEPQSQTQMSAPAAKQTAPMSAAVDRVFRPPERNLFFLDRVEAVRGLAAMAVAITHCIWAFPHAGWQKTAAIVLNTVVNGEAAVAVFFVLSGLVLGMSLKRSKDVFAVEYDRFLIRRVFRIYPAFLAVVVVIVLFLFLNLSNPVFPAMGPWFGVAFDSYTQPPRFNDVISDLVFNSTTLNKVAWTLRVEMICSLLLPLFHRLALKLSIKQCLVLLGALSLLSFINLADAMQYMFLFFAGYLLPRIGPDFIGRLQKRGRLASWILAVVTLAFLLLPSLIEGQFRLMRLRWFLEGCASVSLIACLLYGKEIAGFRLLDHPVARLYGRISYSFYLWHSFCFYLVALCLARRIPEEMIGRFSLVWSAVFWVLSVLLATVVGCGSYRWIEKPLIDKSKQICARFFTKSGVKPLAG